MIERLREHFNEHWTEAKYTDLQRRVAEKSRMPIDVRICETPIFIPANLMQTMVDAGSELVQQLLENPEYMLASDAAIPDAYRMSGAEGRPQFLQVDFGLVRTPDGALEPRLVELQGFPSVYGYQPVLAQAYLEAFGLTECVTAFWGGMDEGSYWEALRRVIVADHDPERVVLMEVEPEKQKTAMDFRIHEDRLGIRTVDIAKVRKAGRKLEYEWRGEWIPIDRIYNRAIVDEIVRKGIVTGFDYREDLDVEWAGHPNWYFRISKFSLPWLRHPTVPAAVFLDAWFRGEGRDRLPEDRENWILKPLYSFAGKGIVFAPDDAMLACIPLAERKDWLLQERVSFAPVIETPEGPTQAEIRIMYLWPEKGHLTAVMNLVRMGRGRMMGVDHNRDQTWVGGSAGLIAEDA
jgi:hypothetical protein